MDNVTQIKQNLNIVDVIGSYVELKKSGRNYKGLCPFHSEKTPSFMVSPEIQQYRCFGCGESGDMFNFVQRVEGIEFAGALEILGEKAGVKIEKDVYDPNAKKKKIIFEINEVTATFYEHLLNHPAGKNALDYVKNSRKLSKKTVEDFRVGYAPNTWDTLYKYLKKRRYQDKDLEMAGVVAKRRSGDGYIDKFRNRVMFPLIDVTGKVVGFTGRVLDDGQPKYLNTAETLVFYKSSYLYGLNVAKTHVKKEGAIFVEGQMDVISAHQAGINNIICTSGTSLTTGQLKLLSRYTNDIVFAFDSDSAGQNATLRAIELAEQQNFNVKTVIIPDEYADIDELIQDDKAKAKALVKEPIPIYDYYISTAFRKYDKSSALGKKQIMEDLAPKFAKINNSVILDHYVKEISQELDLNDEIVRQLISTKESALRSAIESSVESQNVELQKDEVTTEEYMLALLYSAKLDLVQSVLYKLGKKDFTDEQLREIFIALKAYTSGRKRKFDIKYFSKKLDEKLRERAIEIHLIDLGDIADSETLLEKEVDLTFKRLKQNTINRELKALNEQLKAAEKAKDAQEIESLSKKVYKISKQKKLYE